MAQDTQNKDKNYLSSLSNKELDAMYASVARTTGNNAPAKELKEIEAEMEKRYVSYQNSKTAK